MPYHIAEVDLMRPLERLIMPQGRDGLGLIFRWGDELVGFTMLHLPQTAIYSLTRLRQLADEQCARAVLALKARRELAARWQPASALPSSPLPSLSIVICTKDRAARLARLLRSLDAICATSPFSATEIIVVDNAPSDNTTRDATSAFPGIAYVREARVGLNFARNAALRAATGGLIAYLDDDVTVDRNWLNGLAQAWRGCPGAGGFTGLVLPYRLDTEAQIMFERRGGFGRGFERREHRATRFDDATHPVGSGNLGAGCNMAFDRALLLALGGFDEALDTGAPLPGGGDLDIFYRVLRAGRTMIYEPQYAVYHEHRETIAQLRRQYWTWGLGFMAYVAKCRRSDPGLAQRQRAITSWWLRDRLNSIAGAARRRAWREMRFAAAELRGGLQGIAGEYERSRKRIEAIRRAAI